VGTSKHDSNAVCAADEHRGPPGAYKTAGGQRVRAVLRRHQNGELRWEKVTILPPASPPASTSSGTFRSNAGYDEVAPILPLDPQARVGKVL
jgi:hypothetical protein